MEYFPFLSFFLSLFHHDMTEYDFHKVSMFYYTPTRIAKAKAKAKAKATLVQAQT